MKRILILTADMGFGHRNAAQAVEAALNAAYGHECTVQVANPLDDERTPAFLRNTQADYDASVRQMPGLRKLGYQITDAPLPNAVIESSLTVSLFQVIRSLLRKHQPDAVVATYQNYLAPLAAVLAFERRRVPLITVITDHVSLQRIWFNDAADVCCVPTTAAFDLALNYGLPAERLHLTGIPVNPRLATDSRDRAEIRADLGWEQDLVTVLAAGSKRVQGLPAALRGLNHSGLPLQIIAVAGGDDALYGELLATEWHQPARVYNFVDNMPAMMRAADLILCKAGGLIVAEALAAGLPILVFDVIEGWESGNADYVIENGAGERASDPLDVLEITCHWLQAGRKLLDERAANARRIGFPRAAFDIADLVWQAALEGPVQTCRRCAALQPHGVA